MNFAVPYFNTFCDPQNPNVEFNIKYKPRLDELKVFIQRFKDHRINIMIDDLQEKDCNILNIIKDTFPDNNIIICWPLYSQEIESKLNEKLPFPHYYGNVVTSFDTFKGFLDLNITDILIGEELGFYLDILSYQAKEKGKRLRCFCNVKQTSWPNTQSIKTFFIRPEDIDLYSKYIDTFEFFSDPKEQVRINTYYEIYAKDKKWLGKLQDLIIGYTGQESSHLIDPAFGLKRISCRKKCNYKKSDDAAVCHFCDNVVELSKVLEENNLIIKKIKT